MKKLFVISTFILLAQYGMAQNDVFVSTTGNDATGTGSITQPFKTAAKAVQSGLLTPGSNLYFRSGTYYNPNYQDGDIWKQENTVFINSIDGTATQYINIKPYNNETVIIRGDGHMIFQIRSSSYVKISGFEIYGETNNLTLADAIYHQFEFKRTSLSNPVELRLPRGTNTDQSGLEDLTSFTIYRPSLYMGHGLVVQNSHHIEVFDNLVHHIPGEGIRYAGCDYIKIYQNEVHNCGRRSSGGVHGISGYNQRSIDNYDGAKTFISRNLVHDNYQEFPSWSENKTIFTATIDEGKGITLQRINGGNEWLHGRIQIDNNITFRNGFSGVHINDGMRTDIINNTSYLDCRTGQGNQIGISVQTGDDVKIYNNIVYTKLTWGGNTIGGSSMTNMVVANNLINGNLDNELTGIAVNTITSSDFKWVDTLNRNFHLQSNSPGINNALAGVTPPTDFYSVIRGANPDRGAVEYVIIVPLTLLRFSAEKSFEGITLNWVTANEINTAFFEVQHSTDAHNWKPVTTVPAKGNTNGSADYHAIHLNPPAGINYYRLKQTDADTKNTYSQVVKISISENQRLTVYPNPCTEFVIIKNLSDIQGIRLYSLSGVDVTGQVRIRKNTDGIKLETNNLPSGSYILLVNNQSYIITKAK